MKTKTRKKKPVTGRTEHLHFNGLISIALCLGCPIILVSLIFIFATEKRYDLLQWWWMAALILTPVMYRNHEKLASPDMDSARGGLLGWYWKPYAKVIRHRGIFSHTLLIGSPTRFAIAYAFPLLALVIVLNWPLVAQAKLLAEPGFFPVAKNTLYIIENLTMPGSVQWFILWWCGVCAFSDFSHLMCDRMFNPIKFLILGDP